MANVMKLEWVSALRAHIYEEHKDIFSKLL